MALELPRHVHKPGGGRSDVSKIVHDDADLEAALADGWVIDPNAPLAIEGTSEETKHSEDSEDSDQAVRAELPTRKPGRPKKQS